MFEERKDSVDFWDELEEAQQTVERWPPWRQRYDADMHYEEEREDDGSEFVVAVHAAVGARYDASVF
jgi:hypothetical protein